LVSWKSVQGSIGRAEKMFWVAGRAEVLVESVGCGWKAERALGAAGKREECWGKLVGERWRYQVVSESRKR